MRIFSDFFLSERWRMESGRLQEISVMREFLWKESNLLKKTNRQGSYTTMRFGKVYRETL